MPPHRKLEVVDPRVLARELNKTPSNHYVIWTGHPYGAQQGSLRSQALGLIKTVGTPVSLRTLLSQAASINGAFGFEPATVRSSVHLHQGAKPAVYLLVEKRPSGDYVALKEIPHAGAQLAHVNAGRVLIDRNGGLHSALSE